MKTRKLELGDRNLIGARVTKARQELDMKQVELLAKLQLAGVDMSVQPFPFWKVKSALFLILN